MHTVGRKSQVKGMYIPHIMVQMRNCMVYNKHHPTNQMDTAHSSLDKKCPSLIAVLTKYKKNADY
jgi:hypothetical protein